MAGRRRKGRLSLYTCKLQGTRGGRDGGLARFRSSCAFIFGTRFGEQRVYIPRYYNSADRSKGTHLSRGEFSLAFSPFLSCADYDRQSWAACGRSVSRVFTRSSIKFHLSGRAIHIRFASHTAKESGRGKERDREVHREWNRFLGRSAITKKSWPSSREIAMAATDRRLTLGPLLGPLRALAAIIVQLKFSFLFAFLLLLPSIGNFLRFARFFRVFVALSGITRYEVSICKHHQTWPTHGFLFPSPD